MVSPRCLRIIITVSWGVIPSWRCRTAELPLIQPNTCHTSKSDIACRPPFEWCCQHLYVVFAILIPKRSKKPQRTCDTQRRNQHYVEYDIPITNVLHNNSLSSVVCSFPMQQAATSDWQDVDVCVQGSEWVSVCESDVFLGPMCFCSLAGKPLLGLLFRSELCWWWWCWWLLLL